MAKQKRSEPGVGPRHFNPLQNERLTSTIYSMTERGRKTSAKTILQDAAVQRRIAVADARSRAQAESIWQEICRQSNLEHKKK